MLGISSFGNMVLDTNAEFVLLGGGVIMESVGLVLLMTTWALLTVAHNTPKVSNRIGLISISFTIMAFGAFALTLNHFGVSSVSPEFADHLSVKEVDSVLEEEVGPSREMEKMEYDSAEETYSGMYVLSNDETFESDYYDVTVELDGTISVQMIDDSASPESDKEEA